MAKQVEGNWWRQLDVFDPGVFTKEIHVVGAGAIGSHVVETLIKAGIGNIHVYDMDKVEDYNIPNQAYRRKHIGMQKVQAMAELAAELGAEITAHDGAVEKIDLSTPGYVFIAVDNMEVRKSIFDSLEFNPNARVVEARMAAQYGEIYYIDMLNLDQLTFWRSNWFPSASAPDSVCTNRAVGTTAKFMASIMVHCGLINWEANDRKGEVDRPPPRHFVSLGPLMVMEKKV